MSVVAIGLGSNMGDRAATLRGALADLGLAGRLQAVSSVYQTEPVGGPEGQMPYLNAVCLLETDDEPATVLDLLQGIENRWGRVRSERWGPRTLDLDLLLYDDRSIDDTRLTVPHPRLADRRFVLEPLAEVLPSAQIEGRPIAAALNDVGSQEVERIAGPEWANLSDRGLAWVVGQGVVIVLLLLSLLDSGSLPWGRWAQWVGRMLVVGAAVLFIWGMRSLGRNLVGFPEPVASGELVTSGLFRWIRHPLYSANVILILGIALHQRSLAGLVVAGIAGVFFWLKAGHEEIRLSLRYPGYRAYMRTTLGRLAPGL